MEGKGYIIKDESLKMEGKIVFEKPKSYSIIAMNLETVEDVEKVIRQCEFVKEQITSGYSVKKENIYLQGDVLQ